MKIKKFRHSLLLMLMVFGLSVHAGAGLADQSAQFFESIQDLPLMSGLEELEDQTILFDKPQGRIVETVARIDADVSPVDIRVYYDAALPAFGWMKSEKDVYRRGGETLHFRFESVENEAFLRITLSPYN